MTDYPMHIGNPGTAPTWEAAIWAARRDIDKMDRGCNVRTQQQVGRAIEAMGRAIRLGGGDPRTEVAARNALAEAGALLAILLEGETQSPQEPDEPTTTILTAINLLSAGYWATRYSGSRPNFAGVADKLQSVFQVTR
jgi:hypothetical protein